MLVIFSKALHEESNYIQSTGKRAQYFTDNISNNNKIKHCQAIHCMAQ